MKIIKAMHILNKSRQLPQSGRHRGFKNPPDIVKEIHFETIKSDYKPAPTTRIPTSALSDERGINRRAKSALNVNNPLNSIADRRRIQ